MVCTKDESKILYSRILQFLCSSSFNYFYLGLTLAPLPSLSMYWIPKAGWDAQRNNEIKKVGNFMNFFLLIPLTHRAGF